MNLRLSTVVALLLSLAALPARAQWVTQTLSLKAGWNAVFLHVDASHLSLDQWFGPSAPVVSNVDEVWRWNPNPTTGQFVTSPQQPQLTDTQWASWKVTDGGNSVLSRLTPNAAYLFHASADTTIALKGRPVIPVYHWTTSGLNFLGFPTVTGTPPSFESFFNQVPAILQGEIFRYPGGDLGANNPVQVFALRTTPVQRGQAYWLRAGESYNHYYGPFEILAAGGGDISFGSNLSTYGFRIRNVTSAPLTVTLQLGSSETPPAGKPTIAGLPPLLVRGDLNRSTLTYSSTRLTPTSSRTWTLSPAGQQGAEADVVLGLDRARLDGNPGDLFAGVLSLTDSLGQIRVDVGVSAIVGSTTGLWVGNASVSQVGAYLTSYQRDTSNQPLVGADGRYLVSGSKTNLGATASPFPLRLIVHNPATGPASLFQQLFYGFDASTNAILATREASLAASQLAKARRISATHLPWSESNLGWTFDQPLRLGGTLTVLLTNVYNDHASNPFLHTYHPDHDNLDSTFKNELPQGSESYSVIREITLSIQPPAADFASIVGANSTVGGVYQESIRLQGLARSGGAFDTRRFNVQGTFTLNRISDLPTITRLP